MSICIQRSRDQEAVRWGLLALAFLSWLFTLISVQRCTFLLSGDEGTPNQLLYAWGLFSTPSYRDGQQGEHNLLGCIPYPTSVTFGGAFKVARSFGVLLAMVMTLIVILATSIQLFIRENIKLYFQLFRGFLIAATICQLLTFSAFGADFCVRVEDTGLMKIPSKCVPGAAGIVAIFNTLILTLMGSLSFMVPPPKYPFFEIRRFPVLFHKQIDAVSNSKSELEKAIQRGRARGDDTNATIILDSVPQEISQLPAAGGGEGGEVIERWEQLDSESNLAQAEYLAPAHLVSSGCGGRTGSGSVKVDKTMAVKTKLEPSSNGTSNANHHHFHHHRSSVSRNDRRGKGKGLDPIGERMASPTTFESESRARNCLPVVRGHRNRDRSRSNEFVGGQNQGHPHGVDRSTADTVVSSLDPTIDAGAAIASLSTTEAGENATRSTASLTHSPQEQRKPCSDNSVRGIIISNHEKPIRDSNSVIPDHITLSGQTSHMNSAINSGGGRGGAKSGNGDGRETVKVTVEHYPSGKKTYKEITYPDGSKNITTITETTHVDGSKTVTSVVEEIDPPDLEIGHQQRQQQRRQPEQHQRQRQHHPHHQQQRRRYREGGVKGRNETNK